MSRDSDAPPPLLPQHAALINDSGISEGEWRMPGVTVPSRALSSEHQLQLGMGSSS